MTVQIKIKYLKTPLILDFKGKYEFQIIDKNGLMEKNGV